MKMEEEPQQFSHDDEDETTLVAPRFDEEETIIARAVVPLEGGGRVYARRALRRPWPLALILVSALVGVCIGGAGLRFYQTRTSEANGTHEPVNVAAQAQPAPPAETKGETTNAESVGSADGSGGDGTDARVVENPNVESGAKDAETGAKNDEAGGKKTEGDKKRESEAASTSERRAVSDEGAGGTPKLGKKGEDESQAARGEQRPRRVEYDTQAPIPDDSSPAAARARRVEDALRRAERARERRRQRRENASRTPDSIEGIFEGQPR
jgi:hypothetical protein